MKEYLIEMVGEAASPARGRNEAREYLKARILGALQRAGAMIPLAFHGGTALRFLFASSRHSEGLDFALEKDRSLYDFRGFLRVIRSELGPEGYSVTLKESDQRAVHSAFIRFPGLLYELGLSSHRDRVLSVKIEVDTNPPAGAVLTTTVVRRHVTLQLQHHDRASLLAGILHAILQRPYVKGRDLYDLLWYLGDPDWPPPNLMLLNNALEQTSWTGECLTEASWRGAVRNRLQTIPWDQVAADVRPLLKSDAELPVLNRENLMRVLE